MCVRGEGDSLCRQMAGRVCEYESKGKGNRRMGRRAGGLVDVWTTTDLLC